jgi:wyosine [tRNA(Phe)-imidazoG37] synthetase (radical SAM superfamily)
MSNLIKIVLFTSPVIFILFWYVVSQQRKLDVEIQKEDVVFERDWNEFSSEFSKNKKYQQRAEQAEKKLSEIEQMEKEKQKKAEEFEKELDKTLLDKTLKEEEPELVKKLQRVKGKP